MSEETQEEQGPAEASTVAVFERGWRPVTIEQRGPDGSEVLAMLMFASCPLCGAVVPAAQQEGSHSDEFMNLHANWHLRQARDFDVLNVWLEQTQPEGDDG